MHEYYVYIAAGVVAVVLIVLLLIAARSRSTAGPAPAAGPDALDVADALDAEVALNVADALDVVHAVGQAQAHSPVQSRRPPARAVASRTLPARARVVRALPAPVAAEPASQPTLEEVAAELVEAEIVEDDEAIPWLAEEEARGEQSAEEAEPVDAAAERPAQAPARVTVVGVRRDDPQVLAAASEAQRNLQEFQSAFAARTPGQTFAVKVPFSHPGGREFMWVAVRSIADGAAAGRLASEPVEVTELRRGDAVRVKLDDVSDWLYRAADKSAPPRGAFTAEAVKAAAVVG